MNEREHPEPEYQLVERSDAVGACRIHAMQELVQLYNDKNWDLEVIDPDNIRFTCQICGSSRVYQLLETLEP